MLCTKWNHQYILCTNKVSSTAGDMPEVLHWDHNLSHESNRCTSKMRCRCCREQRSWHYAMLSPPTCSRNFSHSNWTRIKKKGSQYVYMLASSSFMLVANILIMPLPVFCWNSKKKVQTSIASPWGGLSVGRWYAHKRGLVKMLWQEVHKETRQNLNYYGQHVPYNLAV